MIKAYSNQYALEVMGSAKFIKWTPISNQEIEAFLGFNFLMELSPMSSIVDYLKRDPVYNYLPIADKISRLR